MATETPTNDISKFGNKERYEAGKLLIAHAEQGDDYLGDGVTVWFNQDSGNVFLCDEDYNVAMMNGNKLEQWFNCPYCGHEGFKEEMGHEPENKECTEYLKEIGAIKEDEE